MQALIAPLSELAEYEEIHKKRAEGPGMLQISNCSGSQTSHFMYSLSDGFRYKIIALSTAEKANVIYEEYRFLSDRVCLYPAKDMLFSQADVKGKYLQQQRMEAIRAILFDQEEDWTIVTTIDGFMDGVCPLEQLRSRILSIKPAQTLHMEEAAELLSRAGYERTEQTETPGQFAIRGGILDIYPLTEELPVRIELWGDEVDSIRSFDPESQRSVENLQEITICPLADLQEGEKGVSFLDYFPKSETLLFLDEPMHLLEQAQAVEAEVLASRERRLEEMRQGHEELRLAESPLHFGTEEILKRINAFSSVGFTLLDVKCKGFLTRKVFRLDVRRVNPYNASFETLTRDLARLKRSGYRVVLLSSSRTRAKRLAEDLRDYDLLSFYSEDMGRLVQPGEILVACGHVAEGYEYPMLKFMVISESDIFGRKKTRRRRKKTYEGRKIQDFSELRVGDYVVHENHGIGIYQGIEKIELDKITKDYMKISYAEGGALYIPATQLDLIQKYANADAKKPRLNKLGSPQWGRTKTQVKSAVKLVAQELVNLYAHRQEQDGFQYGPDTVWQREFEEMFPFEETEDQLQAIREVKEDMESHKIMDRLICGDVGFGKTEIAIRAAFKAVQENKQVVYLVPTTILAQQHYNTFVQRMKDFPVRVDLLCRFRTPLQQKETLKGLKSGMVDILIGTHRVLSKDVSFKDLGLLIIDEEQRFGVTHKEKIKKLRENVDVLTLTATPIPRTLHMSLIGIRDMSVLEEAPQDRMPIQTYVMEYNSEMVREAIERELSRGGQVYYVYNRIQDIDKISAEIQKQVPDATVAYAHGRMSEHRLEDIMYDFINGDIDVLVSTTIIETGLDIPNVNTIIIHDADRMGLSQLYQLRGRVGRSSRMAYAFLLYRRDKLLKEVAEKRLAAIREFTDLGSGFRIAMRDLEIRGAGNLLGAEQHGHMEAVGYDLYCKLLNEAVKRLKGQEKDEEEYTTTIDLDVDAFIPNSYITNEKQKLDVYKRIAAIENEEEMDDITEELIDRFGDIPLKVQKLLRIAALKALAHSAYVTAVEQKAGSYRFVMYEKARVSVQKIPGLLEAYKGDLLFRMEEPPFFLYSKKKRGRNEKKEDALEIVKKVLNDIKGLLE